MELLVIQFRSVIQGLIGCAGSSLVCLGNVALSLRVLVGCFAGSFSGAAVSISVKIRGQMFRKVQSCENQNQSTAYVYNMCIYVLFFQT